jgi:hypothetical protein
MRITKMMTMMTSKSQKTVYIIGYVLSIFIFFTYIIKDITISHIYIININGTCKCNYTVIQSI